MILAAVFLAVAAIAIPFYFLPTIWAVREHNPPWARTVVVTVNVLLGWTVVGWCSAMAIAYWTRTAMAHRFAHLRPRPPVFSPDGCSWWDGYHWNAYRAPAPPAPPPPPYQAQGLPPPPPWAPSPH